MLEIAYTPLDDLVVHERNPKAHDVEGIAGAIRRFGFMDPVVVDERTGKLAAGHGRLAALDVYRRRAAAGEQGWTEPPAGIDVRGDVWLVPQVIGWQSASDAEAEAALVALNRWTEVGGWDDEALLDLLQDLAADDALAGVGYDDDDLDELRARLDAARSRDLTDDDPPPLPDEPTARPGEVWTVGPHRIVCGDATDPRVLAAALDGAVAEMVWTDPPYGVAYESKGAKVARPIRGDDLDLATLEALLRDSLGPALRQTRPGSPWYVACPAGPSLLAFATVLTELGVWRQTICWAKDRMVLSRHDYHGQHESLLYGWTPDGPPPPVEVDEADAAYLPEHDEILYGWTPGGRHVWIGGRQQTSVWSIPRPSRSVEHPTMKPLALVGRSILNSSLPGAVVLDPFAGSGSTLVAAARTDRVGVGIELDPGYVDVVVSRLVAETGESAARADGVEA